MSKSDKNRIVLLPKELDIRLNDLVNIKDEVNGILIYKFQKGKLDHYYPILSIFMTGKGNPGHVQADSQRIAIANELFSKHLDYGLVKFHTHSIGTIKAFGEYYATNFSQEDINIYEEQIKQDSRFIGMVITPKTKLLYGRNSPVLKIINQSIPKIGYQISNDIREIAKQMEYELKNFVSKKIYNSSFIL